MFIRLLSAFVIFIFALIGTAFGNVARVVVDKSYRARHVMPDTDDLIITGVLSNGLIATAIAIVTGRRRLWGAFVGGAVLTLVLGDRLDRDPKSLFGSEADTQARASEKNGKPSPSESIPTGDINAS